MTKEQVRFKYPEVEELFLILERNKIDLNVLPNSSALDSISFIEIEFNSPTFSCNIPLDDEYEDSKLVIPVLLLQLILHACYEFEDHDDITGWSTAFGLDISKPLTLDLYKQTAEIVPQIRKIIGKDLQGVSDYDWQLNAGAAQALRELQK
ncbi:MAG: hypothetical protein RLN90_00860 [Balneolaceae bacterium]